MESYAKAQAEMMSIMKGKESGDGGQGQPEERTSAFQKYFDYVNFPNLSVQDQLKAIPKEFLEKISLPNEIVTRSKPGVTLTKKPSYHTGTSNCDARH